MHDASATYDGTIDDGTFRSIALTKIGSGTQSLRGTNGYTGATTVNAGTLAVDGSIFSSVTVNGGMLGGQGSVYNSVTVSAGGSIRAGSNTGILTLFNGLDLSAGGTNIWELAANSDNNPGTDFDQIVLTGGNLDMSNATLVVKFTGSATAPYSTDAFWQANHTWTIGTLAGSATNPTNLPFANIAKAE